MSSDGRVGDCRPFLKWVGGKTQLLPELLKRAPPTFGSYFEPFLGGGAMFFALRPDSAYLSDANAELVTTYTAIRDDVEGVVSGLQSLCLYEPTRERFEEIRAWESERPSDVAARMIYLNKTCFNGLYRVNKSGKFNVPFGKWKTPPNICDADNLRMVSAGLKGKTISHRGYGASIAFAMPGDFVYLDPPYVPVSETANFTGYTSSGFGPSDQLKLADAARVLRGNGVHVMLSNADTPVVRELYSGWKIDRVEARRAVSCKGIGRGPVGEVIITPEN